MKLLYTALLAFFTGLAFGQTSDSKRTPRADTVPAADTSAVGNVFSAGIGYGNTANYYGQTTAARLPYGSFDVTFKGASGLWAAASALKLFNTSDGISEVDLSAGYDFPILKRLEGSLSYTRFIFPENSPLPQSLNPNTLSAGLIGDAKWFESSLYGDYVFGKADSSDIFVTFSNSKLIDLGSVFSKNDYITIEPSVQFTGGTQILSTSTTTTSSSGSGGSGGLFGSSRRLLGGKNIPGSQQNEQVTTVYSSKFSLITTNFRLPVAYNRAHYSLEAAYQLSVPNKNFEGIDHKAQSYFTLGFNYYFFKD